MTTLAAALVAAQGEMPAVKPDSINPHFRSEFVSLGHLIATTKPVLTRHGLAIVQAPSAIDGQPALTTTLVHAESGEQITDTMPLLVGKADMQGLGGAITYGRRYMWASMLGISDQTDDDGNTASASAEEVSPGGEQAAERQATTRPAATANAATFTFPFGKYKGKTIAQVADENAGYLTWCLDQTTGKEDIKDLIREYLNLAELDEVGAVTVGAGDAYDEGIPFMPTIDGSGN